MQQELKCIEQTLLEFYVYHDRVEREIKLKTKNYKVAVIFFEACRDTLIISIERINCKRRYVLTIPIEGAYFLNLSYDNLEFDAERVSDIIKNWSKIIEIKKYEGV